MSFVYFFIFLRYAINSDQKHVVFRVEERVTYTAKHPLYDDILLARQNEGAHYLSLR